MALPINIEDLLNKRRIESNRKSLRKAGILPKFTKPFVPLPTILTTLEGGISWLV